MWFSYKEDYLHIKESVRTTSIFLSQKKESIDRSVVVSNRYIRTVNYVINCMSLKKMVYVEQQVNMSQELNA